MERSRNGFTLIELVVVILIGSILVGVAMNSFQSAQSAYRARSGKTVYATLHQLARARAVELGQTVLLYVDTDGDSAFTVDGGSVNNVTHFRSELGVDLRATPTRFRICMTPRGYADPDCPALALTATSSSPITLEFWQGGDSSTVVILPMGQLVGL
jgi:prepilin-type N-terminal cleavage/methylation domain-containing protein